MNFEWSLDVLYKGYEDPTFTSDIQLLETKIKEYKSCIASISTMEANDALKKLIQTEESLSLIASRLILYVNLRETTDTTNTQTTAIKSKLLQMMSTISKESALQTKFIASISNIDAILSEDEYLKQYEFRLKNIIEKAKHTLSDEVEEVITKLNLSAGNAWSMMQQYLTSTVVVDYKGEQVTLSNIRNLAYDSDATVRKEAFEAEVAAYEKIKAPISFSLNNIKSQVSTICELRGYSSPLEMTLKESDMKQETLDAMLTAMKEYMPKFHSYLRRKGELLGSKNGLAWYDLFAPMGHSTKTFTIEEAKDYLIQLFSKFSNDLADMVKEAFDHNWIDFYPRAGKVGGAFCMNLPFIKQSRVLTNFDGSLSSVVTLAHELGHAYHGLLIQDHLPLNTDYSMPVAETASTFNETLVMSAAIAEASGNEKMALIESQLQDVTQIICDIYSRFLFEQTVFERRKEEFLFPDELCEIMTDCQKEAYGNGLDVDTLHPYMWITKGHYYSEALSYYNFPYAFGGLFARGLYSQYQKNPKEFVPKYRSLLHATTVTTVEGVAKMADIDLTTPEFWRESLQSFSTLIDEFLELTK